MIFRSFNVKKIKSGAFTLAEVLITVGIIGVIAAVTIPNLINTAYDEQYKVAYKKAFADASSAVIDLNRQKAFTGINMNSTNFSVFMSKFKIAKDCTINNNIECWVAGEKYGSWNSPYAYPNAYAFADVSGRVWSLPYNSNDDYFFVDTNGIKGPNQWGKDRFALSFLETVTGSGIVKIKQFSDNFANICVTGNKCNTENNYYGTSWLKE